MPPKPQKNSQIYTDFLYNFAFTKEKKNRNSSRSIPCPTPPQGHNYCTLGPNAKFEAFLIIYFQARDYVQLPTEFHMQLSTHSLTPDTNVELLAFFHTLYHKINKKSNEKQMSSLIIWQDCLSFFAQSFLLFIFKIQLDFQKKRKPPVKILIFKNCCLQGKVFFFAQE